MRIAVAQLDTSHLVPGDAARRLLESARIAADAGARLMLCPYTALTHPIPPDSTDQVDYVLEVTEAIGLLSREAALPLLLCGAIDMNGFVGDLAFYIHDGVVEPLSTGERGALPGVESAIEFDGVSFVVACTHDDLDFLVENKTDADMVVFACAHSFSAADALTAMGSGFLEGTLSGLAQELDSWLVGAASLGGYGEDVYCGASFVVTPWGELAARVPAFEESLLMCDIDVRSEGPLESPAEPDYFDRPLMVWLALSLGLSDLLRTLGKTEVVLPLDGSLASMLLCVLASDALGPTNVHVVLPATMDRNRWDQAEELARVLGVNQHQPDMRMSALLDETGFQARVRSCLAHISAGLGALPLLALDKTALALEPEAMAQAFGWLAPLGDIYRLDLAELVRMRNTISPVISRAALRELDVPNIEAVNSVAASSRACLEFADMVMMGRVEGMRTPSELAHSYGHPEAVDALMKRFSETAPLRRGVSVIRVSSRALVDLVQPLGLAWRNEVHEEPAMDRAEAIMAKLLAGIPSKEAEPSQVGDMINLLQDIAGSSTAVPPRNNPFVWGIPFSEN